MKRDDLLQELDEIETMYGNLLTKVYTLNQSLGNSTKRVQASSITFGLCDNLTLFSTTFKKELKVIHHKMDNAVDLPLEVTGNRLPESDETAIKVWMFKEVENE